MDIKALFVNACINCECYGSFEFLNGHGIARKEVLSLK